MRPTNVASSLFPQHLEELALEDPKLFAQWLNLSVPEGLVFVNIKFERLTPTAKGIHVQYHVFSARPTRNGDQEFLECHHRDGFVPPALLRMEF